MSKRTWAPLSIPDLPSGIRIEYSAGAKLRHRWRVFVPDGQGLHKFFKVLPGSEWRSHSWMFSQDPIGAIKNLVAMNPQIFEGN